MQFRDVIHLSFKNLKSHPKRTLFLIVTTGIIFTLIFTVNFWWQGLQNAYLSATSYATHSRIILQATTSPSPQSDSFSHSEIAEDLQRFGATILGDAKYYGSRYLTVLDPSLVEPSIEVDLATTPTDAAPVLVDEHLATQFLDQSYSGATRTARAKQQNYETYRSALLGQAFTDASGSKYFVVGLAPGRSFIDNFSFASIIYKNNSLFNPFLENIPTPSSASIVLKNNYVMNHLQDFTSPSSNPSEAAPTFDPPASIIATFDDFKQANAYLHHGNGAFPNLSLSNRKYNVNIIAGPSPESYYIFRAFTIIINIASIVLLFVAGIIIIFTSIRLVDQNRQNIQLYYSLGATPRQVHLIYLAYFAELMLCATIFAFLLASILVLLFSVTHQELLSIQHMLAFSLSFRTYIVWYGINTGTFLFFGATLLMSPLCLLINHHLLTSKH